MRRAQSSLEFCIIIAVVTAAFLSMSVYIKRAQQGNYRQSADQLGGRYAPKKTNSDMTTRITGVETATTDTAEIDGKLISTTNFDSRDTINTSGWERVGP